MADSTITNVVCNNSRDNEKIMQMQCAERILSHD